MTGRSIRVALADDDALVRSGIASILNFDRCTEVVVEAEDGGQLVRKVKSKQVDVLLLDIRMPRVDGLATLDELARAGIRVPTAMLTTFSREAYIEMAIARGAKGFLLKSDAPEDLIRNIHALAQGGAVFSPRIANWLIRSRAVQQLRARRSAHEQVAALTDRQREILEQLSTGAGNAEIGASLHLSEGTVKQYLRAIFDELGVQNRVQAALIGYEARA